MICRRTHSCVPYYDGIHYSPYLEQDLRTTENVYIFSYTLSYIYNISTGHLSQDPRIRIPPARYMKKCYSFAFSLIYMFEPRLCGSHVVALSIWARLGPIHRIAHGSTAYLLIRPRVYKREKEKKKVHLLSASIFHFLLFHNPHYFPIFHAEMFAQQGIGHVKKKRKYRRTKRQLGQHMTRSHRE